MPKQATPSLAPSLPHSLYSTQKSQFRLRVDTRGLLPVAGESNTRRAKKEGKAAAGVTSPYDHAMDIAKRTTAQDNRTDHTSTEQRDIPYRERR